MGSATGLLTRGSLPRRLPGLRQWLRGGGASPLTAAGPSRIRTGFPHRAPDCGRAYHRTVSGSFARLWLPVVAWAALIFAFSSVPDLGTGLGGWDLVLRKIAHAAEYAILGALLVARDRAGLPRRRTRHAVRGQRRGAPVVRAGTRRLAARRGARRGGRRRRGRPLATRSAPGGSRDDHPRGRDRPRRARRHARALGRVARLGSRRAGRRSGHAARRPRRGCDGSSTRPAPATGGSSSSGSARITRLHTCVATRRRARRLQSLVRERDDGRRLHGCATGARAHRLGSARRGPAHLGARDRHGCVRATARRHRRRRDRRPYASRPPEASVELAPWSSTTSEIASSTPSSSASTGSPTSSSA